MEQLFSTKPLVAAIVYALAGNCLLFVSFFIIDKLTPGDLWKEIVIEKNLPFALTVGAITVALGQIIAAAIHG